MDYEKLKEKNFEREKVDVKIMWRRKTPIRILYP